jgi:sporulation protein YlmC with PRC-barrel domain
MKLSLKEILGYGVETHEHVTGKVIDFLLDDEYWSVRYADAELGFKFSDRRILIPQTFLKRTKWASQNFKVQLSKEGLETCPKLEAHLPVSRKYEEELNKHYRISNYWVRNYKDLKNGFDKMRHFELPDQEFKAAPKLIREKDVDTNLRSFNEILGYDILTSDGNVGCIDDLLIESDDWSVISIIVAANKWEPWSKKVIIASTWIEEVSYIDKQIKISLRTKEVENAPEYNTLEPINEVLEKRYYNYLGKPIK